MISDGEMFLEKLTEPVRMWALPQGEKKGLFPTRGVGLSSRLI